MPDDLIEIRLNEVSERIKRRRESGDMTLLQLSERSGVSPSTIQKIESRQMTPSIVVIFKIATGLGMEPADLIAAANPARNDIAVQRSGQHAQMRASDELRFEKLSADIADTDLECWKVHVAPRYKVTLNRPQKFDEQIIVCLTGKFELVIDKIAYQLSAGDTLQCRSKTMYALRNLTARPAVYITTGRFPHRIETDVISMLNQN